MVTYTVDITNTGSVDIEELFFVDIYIDPASVSGIRIPIEDSNGYAAVSGLAGGASAEIIVPAPNGFPNIPPIHQVYGMVDSVEQIVETDETNNISGPVMIDYVTPGPDPIWTPEYPVGSDNTISGVVRVLLRDWVPVQRIEVKLIDGSGQTVATTTTDRNGYYEFRGLPPADFSVTACVTVDNTSFSGSRAGITAPDGYADLFMLPGICTR